MILRLMPVKGGVAPVKLQSGVVYGLTVSQ